MLKNHLIQGYTINQKRLQRIGLEEFEQTLVLVKNAMENKKIDSREAKGLLSVITHYANTWIMLQKYDEDKLRCPVKKRKPEYVLT